MAVAHRILLVLVSLTLAGCNQCRDWGEDPWVPGEVVVGFDEDITVGEIREINAEVGTSIKTCYPEWYCTIDLPAGVGISEAMCFYEHHPRVRFALPNTYVTRGLASADGGP